MPISDYFFFRHKYRPDGHTEAWRQEDHHKGGVRCVEFSDNGTELYSAGSDGTLQAVDSETGSCVWAVENAHSDAINAMVSSRACHVVTGDDEGKIKQWDLRSPPRISVVNEWKEQSDYISDLHVALDGRSLLSTSGDTTLAVFDLRSNKKVRLSDPQEDELLCVKVMKAGRKVRNTIKFLVIVHVVPYLQLVFPGGLRVSKWRAFDLELGGVG